MIEQLVKSAFQTGCLSVASESLLRQIMGMKGCNPSEIEVLVSLEEALNQGQVEREANQSSKIIVTYEAS